MMGNDDVLFGTERREVDDVIDADAVRCVDERVDICFAHGWGTHEEDAVDVCQCISPCLRLRKVELDHVSSVRELGRSGFGVANPAPDGDVAVCERGNHVLADSPGCPGNE